jgi:transcriptional regulator with GAF, ATPase, and Fis domain
MILAEYLFLVLLVLVAYSTYRAKERYFYRSKDSYDKLMIGQGLWGGLLLVRVLGESGSLQQLPVLSDPGYRYLAEALLLVFGGLFMIIGATEWINRMTSADLKATHYQKRLDFLSAVANLSRAKQETRPFLDKLRGLILHFTQAVSVNYYREDRSVGSSIPAESNTIPLTDHAPLQHWCQSVRRSQRLSLIPFEASEDKKPTVVLPLQDKTAESLVMVINWEQGAHIDTDLLQLLDLLAVQLGGERSSAATGNAQIDETAVVLDKLRNDLAAVDRIQDAIHLVDEALHRITEYEILRIAVYDSRGYNVTQYCLGQGKSLLTERNRSISTHKTQLGALFLSPQVTYSDALEQSELEDDRWLISCGARHALTIPIMLGDKPIAALTMAAEKQCPDKEFGEKVAALLSTALVPSVRSDTFAHQLVAYNRQILDLTGSLKKLVTSEDAEAFMVGLAETVVKKLPATYCRFWRYDPAKESLEFVSEAQARDVSNLVTEVRSLPLSRARWHKLAIQAGRMMLINQREERMQMDDQELLQSLVVGLQSALLVPLMAGQEPLGIMAVAELRNWERRSFSLSDSVFVRGIANIASQALMSLATANRVGQLGRHVERLERSKLLGEVFSDLPKRFATPLTSIMARTQQLIDKSDNPDEQTAKNLAIIKMQTERMMKEVRTLQDTRSESLLGK